MSSQHNKAIVWISGWGYSPDVFLKCCVELEGFQHLRISAVEALELLTNSELRNTRLREDSEIIAIVGWSVGGMLATQLRQYIKATQPKVFAICSGKYFLFPIDESGQNMDDSLKDTRARLRGLKKSYLRDRDRTLRDFARLCGDDSAEFEGQDFANVELLDYLLEADVSQEWEQAQTISVSASGDRVWRNGDAPMVVIPDSDHCLPQKKPMELAKMLLDLL